MIRPDREWIEAELVYEGKLTYCAACGAIPAVAIGPRHNCLGADSIAYWEAERIGATGEWIQQAPDYERVFLLEGDRAGSVYAFYEPPQAALKPDVANPKPSRRPHDPTP